MEPQTLREIEECQRFFYFCRILEFGSGIAAQPETQFSCDLRCAAANRPATAVHPIVIADHRLDKCGRDHRELKSRSLDSTNLTACVAQALREDSEPIAADKVGVKSSFAVITHLGAITINV